MLVAVALTLVELESSNLVDLDDLDLVPTSLLEVLIKLRQLGVTKPDAFELKPRQPLRVLFEEVMRAEEEEKGRTAMDSGLTSAHFDSEDFIDIELFGELDALLTSCGRCLDALASVSSALSCSVVPDSSAAEAGPAVYLFFLAPLFLL